MSIKGKILLLLVAGLGTSPALGEQDKLFEGVWVSNAEFCPLMEEIGTRAIFGNDIAIITMEGGFVGFEFYCDFNEFAYGTDGKSVLISATCGDSSEGFEESIYLNLYGGDGADNQMRFEFNSPYITGRDGPERGEEDSRFLFSRCDNLTETMLVERSEP